MGVISGFEVYTFDFNTQEINKPIERFQEAILTMKMQIRDRYLSHQEVLTATRFSYVTVI